VSIGYEVPNVGNIVFFVAAEKVTERTRLGLILGRAVIFVFKDVHDVPVAYKLVDPARCESEVFLAVRLDITVTAFFVEVILIDIPERFRRFPAMLLEGADGVF
jgi:hypothetical protein